MTKRTSGARVRAKVRKKKAVVDAPKPGHIIYHSQVPPDDLIYGYGGNPMFIKAMREGLTETTPWLRFLVWLRRYRPWLWPGVAAIAWFALGWIASTIYSGYVVATACREAAAFEVFGQVFACALGR